MHDPLRPDVMQVALREARVSAMAGDHPIGAVITTTSGQLIASSQNYTRRHSDPTAHAELLAIRAASKLLMMRHIENCILYSTMEPCAMCVSAAVWARVRELIWGASIQDAINYRQESGKVWRMGVGAQQILSTTNPLIPYQAGYMQEKCIEVLKLWPPSVEPRIR